MYVCLFVWLVGWLVCRYVNVDYTHTHTHTHIYTLLNNVGLVILGRVNYKLLRHHCLSLLLVG